MRHQNTKKKLNRDKDSRQALLRSMANSLVLYERIRTTEAKAKAIRPMIEKMITRAKDNSLHSRRELMKKLPTKEAVDKMLQVIGPKYKDRKGGYLRIVKTEPRQGDGAQMAIIELV